MKLMNIGLYEEENWSRKQRDEWETLCLKYRHKYNPTDLAVTSLKGCIRIETVNTIQNYEYNGPTSCYDEIIFVLYK